MMESILDSVALAMLWIIPLGWLWSQNREAKRKRTQPERRRRNLRDIEHAVLLQMGPAGERCLRAMLLDDLRQLWGRRRAQEIIFRESGLHIEITTSREPERRTPWAIRPAWMKRGR